jgi:hypothetical protein
MLGMVEAFGLGVSCFGKIPLIVVVVYVFALLKRRKIDHVSPFLLELRGNRALILYIYILCQR